jgi:alcohol dehydrogenase (cytochrome c)
MRKYMRPVLCATVLSLTAFSWQAYAQGGAADQAFSGSGRRPHFTAAQAERGRIAYAASCAMCHGPQLAGTPAGPGLNDTAFRSQYHDIAPNALYAFIATAMPSNAPASLPTGTYADLAAYLFQANGFTPGDVAFAPPASIADITQAPIFGPVKRDAIYDRVEAEHRAQLAQLTPVDDQMLRKPPDSDWLIWRRTYDAHGYSPLAQINRTNVHSLQVAWSWSLPVSSNEITPLEHDGVLFIKAGNTVEALDAAKGDLLWKYVRPYPPILHDGATEIVKTIAIYQNMLYVPFLDGHMVALDIHTGKALWDHELIGAKEAASRLPGRMDSADPQHFFMVADGGPIVADGHVIVGLAGCSNNYKGGCLIIGLNAMTGQEDWRFNTIARPGQPGGDSWNGAPVDQRFGASVWIPGSYDPQTDLVYFGTGQTYHTSTLLTPGPYGGPHTDALYSDSTVALNPRTGQLVWYYQHFPGDVWDLDWAFEQTLLSLPVHGHNQPLVITGGKIGIFDAVDAATGHYVFSRDLGVQNIVTGIDPVTGAKHIDPALVPRTDSARPKNCGFARDEPSTAYDPQTHLLYVPFVKADCPDPRDLGPDTVAGTRLTGPGKPFDGQYGRLVAFDPTTGKLAWMHRQRASDISSVLATAGGVVFDGTLDRVFRASDARTGRLLWQTRLNNAPKAAPITFSVHGRQYVAVTSGPFENTPRLDETSPEVVEPTRALTLWVFALPETGNPGGH